MMNLTEQLAITSDPHDERVASLAFRLANGEWGSPRALFSSRKVAERSVKAYHKFFNGISSLDLQTLHRPLAGPMAAITSTALVAGPRIEVEAFIEASDGGYAILELQTVKELSRADLSYCFFARAIADQQYYNVIQIMALLHEGDLHGFSPRYEVALNAHMDSLNSFARMYLLRGEELL